MTKTSKKEYQFISWLCGESDYFPFFKDLPELPEIHEKIRCCECGQFYRKEQILPNGMCQGCYHEFKNIINN